jgi:RNA polymerase sigma factor (sigma-70 family)
VKGKLLERTLPVPADSTTQLECLISRLSGSGSDRQGAVDELVARVYSRIGRLARKIFRISFPRLRAAHGTGTVHHEVLIRIRKALQGSQPATMNEFWALSTRIIRNTLIDLARSYDASLVRHAQSLDATDASDANGKRVLEPATWDEAPDVAESWARMHERVSRLPAPQREVFELCFYNGLSQRQAALVLERDPATVNRLWRKAVEQLPALHR